MPAVRRVAGLLAAALLLAAAPAAAEPSSTAGPERPAPWFFAEPTLAVGWWPGVFVVFAPIQARFALHRSESIVFRNTYLGLGAWTRVSPAVVEVGPRIDIAPLDLFDVSITARYARHFPGIVSSRLPFDEQEGKDFATRSARADQALGSHSFDLVIEPTLKGKLGPVIVLYRPTFQFSRIRLDEPTSARWIYDAGRDTLVPPEGAWQIEQQGVLLAELFDGVERATLLRLGGILRHRRVFEDDGDRHVGAGFFGMWRPGRRVFWPTIVAMVIAYVVDTDRVLAAPQVAVALQWRLEARPGARTELAAGLPSAPGPR